MSLKRICLSDADKVFIRQHAEDGRGCGDINDDGHLYFIDETNHVAYQLPDEYKYTPLILYHPCGGYQDGLIMVSLMNRPDLQYHHTFYDTAGMWGWIDLDGEVVIKPQYIFAMSFYNGRAIVCKGQWAVDDNGRYWCDEEKWGIIDRTGKEIVPCLYDEIFDIDNTDSYVLCHKNGWKNGCNCVFDIHSGTEVFDMDFDFDNGYMFNSCFYSNGDIVFTEHEPGGGVDYIFAYGLAEKRWLLYHEEYRERTLNGKTKIVVQKDGQDIIVF